MDRRDFLAGLAVANPLARFAPPSNLSLVCEGDSITFGRTAPLGRDYPSQLARLVRAGSLRSYAVSGSTMADVLDRERMVALAHRSGAENVLTLMIGSNDLAAGADPAALHAAVLAYLARLPFDAILMTILPRALGGEVPDFEARRQAFNATLRSMGGVLVDAAADPRLASLNPTYYADGAHLTDAGCSVLADLLAAAI